MILFGLLVLATTGLVRTQKGINCECYAYFVCQNSTWNNDVECEYPNEVCCALDSTTATPPPLPSSPDPRNSGYVCGGRNKPKIIWKIDVPEGVNGNTQFGEFPWMVAILRRTSKGLGFMCGGSIIYPNMILTAAHSVSGIPASDLVVKAGVWNTTDVSEAIKHQDRNVLQSIIHSGFNKEQVVNDFALLVLNEPLIITQNVAPVCLPSSTRTINESYCIATGWGSDKNGYQNGDILKQVHLPLVDFDTCQRKLGANIKLHNSFLCAGGDANGDTCVGDGGGPLMCASIENPDRYVQIGITSWGTGCGQGDPGAYASVKVAAEWIEQQADLFPPLTAKMQL